MNASTQIVPVLAGGGTRLPAHVGVLQALREMGIGYRHIVGVSGGSIIAALVSIGWPVEELRELARDTDFAQFRGFSLARLLREGGLSSGDSFERWMDEKTGGVTFGELPGNLHIVATDVRSQAPVIFDREYTPELKVSRAVRYSMGIPLLFTFKTYQEKLLVDGSILAEDALRRDWARDGTPMFFFRMRARQGGTAPMENRFFPLPGYMTMLVRTFMTSISREYVRDAYWARTMIVETGEITPLEFGLSRDEKEGLYRAGYEQAMTYVPKKLLAGRLAGAFADTVVGGGAGNHECRILSPVSNHLIPP